MLVFSGVTAVLLLAAGRTRSLLLHPGTGHFISIMHQIDLNACTPAANTQHICCLITYIVTLSLYVALCPHSHIGSQQEREGVRCEGVVGIIALKSKGKGGGLSLRLRNDGTVARWRSSGIYE